jgi:nucleolar protein 9
LKIFCQAVICAPQKKLSHKQCFVEKCLPEGYNTHTKHIAMPNKSKHRGRREEKKLKRKAEAIENVGRKRQKAKELIEQIKKTETNAPPEDFRDENVADGKDDVKDERPFYGMLTDEEQEYFRHLDNLLEQNDFHTPEQIEQRELLLANAYREADGKELKIACSQSCSRLMERLILLGDIEQKKKIFGKFSGNFAHLVQHRFASHCCETLFLQSAPLVTEELTGGTKNGDAMDVDGAEPFISMENLFLFTLNELEGDMVSLLTNRFASHTLRVLLIILSGMPLDKASTKILLQSKKKENVGIAGSDTSPTELTLNKRAVPESFSFAVSKIISDTAATMDQSFIRVLATHPTGNPTLQVLLELELTSKSSKDDSRTILSTLLPDDISAEGSESAAFINGLIYDAIGSRLLETICSAAPGKLFKQIYKTIFKGRIAALARNEIASYVVIRVLNRLSKEELEEAVEAMLPQIGDLVKRNRTVVIKTLVERCQVRGADIDALTETIGTAYGSDPSTLILKMSCIDDVSSLTSAVLPPAPKEGEEVPHPIVPKPAPPQLHGSLLAQAMLAIPGTPQNLLQNSILTLPPSILLTLSLFTPTSYILQSALVPTPENLTVRRKIINKLLTPSEACSDPVLALALSSSGTHILDSILLSAPSLLSLIERVATSLAAHESTLHPASYTGSLVWRNWNMIQFKQWRGAWIKGVQEIAPTSSPAAATPSAPAIKEKSIKPTRPDTWKSRDHAKNAVVEGKTPIQLAREKFAKKKAEEERKKSSKATGANGIVT